MSTRRNFLKQGIFATAGLSLLTQARMVEAAALSNKVVIFLFLYGGNDGLNTIVPMDQYATYQQLRPTLQIPQSKLLVPPGTQIGFNPGMTKLYDRFVNKRDVAVLNGIAMPQDSVGLFAHDACQYVYQTCDIRQTTRTSGPEGWIGNYFDTLTSTPNLTGIDLGGSPLPLQNSDYVPTSISSINDFYLTPSFDTQALQAAYSGVMNVPAANNVVAEYNRTTRVQALADSAVVRQSTSGYMATVTYPSTSLGNSFKNCAQLLYGDMGVRAVTIGAGGWDTHQNQNAGASSTALGSHDRLLQGVSDCIDAFFTDLENLGLADNVLLITMSDFGRNATENADRGTDHGYSSVAFAVGKMVQGGIYNAYPSLTALAYTNKLNIRSDFRSVYATVAERFLGASSSLVTGGSFPLMDFL